MRRFVLFALLAAGLGVLAAPRDARAWGWGHSRVVYYYPAYYCPPPIYYMPCYSARPMYMPPARPVADVRIEDGRFDPKTITIAPGTTVRWTNHGKERHTVTSREGRWDSGELAPGATFRATFLRPGTYRYYCKPHEKMGMEGTVVVSANGAADKKNTHDGTFVSAKDETEFVMGNGKEHTHTLSADAKVIGPDGKEAKLADFKKGQKIRVTTKEGDMKVATKVEALKE